MTGLITDTSDHRLIRQSTGAIASRYGHDYYAERARDGGHIAELWADLGQAGLLGVHLPEQYGGGGAGLADLWFVTRLMRTAPVSREMVLNYVASHSLGLPQSY